MGVVHLATDPDGDQVAVKMLRSSVLGGADGRRRMAREVAAMRRVRGPRVAEVLDADLDSEPPFLVTRYVPGPSLQEAVDRHGPLRPDAAHEYAVGLLEALTSVHAAGLVHRDVKPGNVLMSRQGPVLIDFGIARATEDVRLTMTGVVPGTPAFLAPETLLGADPSRATDVHGWAGTILFAATGSPPYGRGPDVVVLDRIRRDEIDSAALSATGALAPLLRAGLAADPADRPAPDELLVALAGSADPGPSRPPEHPWAPREVQPHPPAADPRPSATDPDSIPPATVVDPPAPATRVDAPQWASLPPAAADRAAAADWPVPPQRVATGSYGSPMVRTAGLSLGIVAAATAGFAIYPAVVMIILGIAVAVGRLVRRSRMSLFERRSLRGSRGSDVVSMVARSPWYAVTAGLGAIGQLALAGSVGLLVGLFVSTTSTSPRFAPLSAGLTVVVLMLWGPMSGKGRWGIRWLARPLMASPAPAWLTTASLLLLAWLLLMAWESFGTTWDPLPPLLVQWLT